MSQDILVQCFADALGVQPLIVVDELKYNSIPQWDSVAHMTLIAMLEEKFDLMLDTDDIIDMSSVAKAKEILSKHGVNF